MVAILYIVAAVDMPIQFHFPYFWLITLFLVGGRWKGSLPMECSSKALERNTVTTIKLWKERGKFIGHGLK